MLARPYPALIKNRKAQKGMAIQPRSLGNIDDQ
jgi:hypothetical protein